MILLKNTSIKTQKVNLFITSNSKKIYINTLVPYFEFKNKIGKIIKARNNCICL